MEKVAGEFGAIGEAVVFLDHFADLPDPRQVGKVIYPLAEVLLLCLLAVLAGAETFVDIARFGEKKIELLRRFRSFHNGTPSHDHLGDIFAALDAEQFQRCFVDWVAALTGAPKEVVAIDGKTLRRSGEKRGAKAPIHMVSAFAARQRLVLGQIKVADKANEIVAIPKLLDLRLRRWLPRQIDIDKVSDEEIQDIILTANLTPRKCLGFKTPFQAILKELGKDVQIRFS